MSELSTKLTQELFTVHLKRLLDAGHPHDVEFAQEELVARAKELVQDEHVDIGAIREMAVYNAGKLSLDFFGADGTFDVMQKPADGSLDSTHAPSRKVWRGTGSSIATVGLDHTNELDVVYYVDKPGEVELMYGSAFPYIVEKLGWMVMADAVLDNRGGYQYIKDYLTVSGRPTAPHIGSTLVAKSEIRSKTKRSQPTRLYISTSGTLPEIWVDKSYQNIPEYAQRAETDEAAGLFDNHIENRRAGLYDVAFGEMVGRLLYGENLNDRMLEIYDSKYYDGVDIN